MKSAQMGAATVPPERPRSWLSSKPIQITKTRLLVNPENQPSREVPVFPAAGNVKPLARTAAPVPLFKTSFIKLSTRYATRGSRTIFVDGEYFSRVLPPALVTFFRNTGSARVPTVAKAVYAPATSTGV